VPIELVLEQLSAGLTLEEVCEEFALQREDVLAVLCYAAEMVRGNRTLEVTWDPEQERWLDDDEGFEVIPLKQP
jgi:hypothetical protein